MTTAIIISICLLLLIAYGFDLTSSKTKIPSVILLLLLGWVVRQVVNTLQLAVPDLSVLLPVFGTIGLILIVLEGSLELEFSPSKIPLIKKAIGVALFPMLLLAISMALLLQQILSTGFRDSLLNIIPLCVISSAIAIPSARSVARANREFIVYESSLSDILGVLLFNFVAGNEDFGFQAFGGFVLELLMILVVTFLATILLALLLRKIDHPIKFAPIILMVILIYALAKVYHLPGLVFILFFGLLLGNLDELKSFRWIQWLHPEKLQAEVTKFHEFTAEATFLVRSLFFLLFGFLIENAELANTETLVWAAGFTAAVFLIRYLVLRLFRLPVKPLGFIAPRGLITILLFLSIPAQKMMAPVNRSLIIQVIILTALVMMAGLLIKKKPLEVQEPGA